MSRSGPVTTDTSTVALGLAQIRVGKSAANISQTGIRLPSTASMGAMASTQFVSNVDYWQLKSGFPQLEDMVLPLSETCSLECAFKQLSPMNLALARGLDPFEDKPAEIIPGVAKTAAGTFANVIAPNDDGGVTEQYTVIFESATAIDIYGTISGHLGNFADLTIAIAPDNGGNPYFTIPANFFTGTWAAAELYTFVGVAAVAGTVAYADAHAGEIKLGQIQTPKFIRMEAVYTYPNKINHMYIVFPRANAVSSLEIDFQVEDNVSPAVTFEAKRADAEVDGGDAVWDSMALGRIFFD